MKTLVRATDPITSVMAAQRAEQFIGSHKQMIMDALNILVQATAEEISTETGLSIEQVDRRVIELERAGQLVIAQTNGLDFIRNGYRVLELPMSDTQREDFIIRCGAYIEVAMHKRDTTSAGAMNKLMTGLIKCRSLKQIKKMEKERGLV